MQSWQSDSREQSILRLDKFQKILINDRTVIGNDDATSFGQNLGDSEVHDVFEVTYTMPSENNTFHHFGDMVVDHGKNEAPVYPFLYGSY